MNDSIRPTQLTLATVRPARTTGWVVAAIAVHLLVTSMASAASSCSETIERTRVTRLSHCVAQAIRELVDQGAEHSMILILDRLDEPVAFVGGWGVGTCGMMVQRDRLGDWLLDLPPPMLG